MEGFQHGLKSPQHREGFPRQRAGFTVNFGKGNDGFADFFKRSIDFSIECDHFTQEMRHRIAPRIESIQSFILSYWVI
jgi:hypothetical protein